MIRNKFQNQKKTLFNEQEFTGIIMVVEENFYNRAITKECSKTLKKRLFFWFIESLTEGARISHGCFGNEVETCRF